MSKIVRVLGSLVVSLLVYSIPVLNVVSYFQNWDGGLRVVLTIVSALQIAAIFWFVYSKTEEGE